jgi:hypothetical protein
MKWIYGLLVILAFSKFTCDSEDCGCISPPVCSGCGLQAVVKDFSNLDGCSIGLELADGTQLIPERRIYIQAPKQEDDPAYYFEFIPGDTVCIAYNEVDITTACMAGKNVFLTCIKKVSAISPG